MRELQVSRQSGIFFGRPGANKPGPIFFIRTTDSFAPALPLQETDYPNSAPVTGESGAEAGGTRDAGGDKQGPTCNETIKV